MLRILENGQKYTVGELAERLEVSKRMIKIYKEELEKAGIYKKSYDIEFNYNDIDNIENILNKLSIKEQNDISITLEKIKTIVIYSADDNKKSLIDNMEVKKRYVILSKAIVNKQTVEFFYHSKLRRFLPYTFSFYKNLIYITGFSYLDNDIRTFNLNEIKDLKKL